MSTADKLTGLNQVLKTSGLTSVPIAASTSSQTVFCMEMAFNSVQEREPRAALLQTNI
jgi:hypothetical protein